MKKVLSVLLVMGMCVGLLAGCGGGTGKDDKGENGGETSDKKKIVFMVKNSNSDFFVSMGEYAKAKAEESAGTIQYASGGSNRDCSRS